MIYPAPLVRVGPPPAGYEEIFWELDGGDAVHGFHGGDRSPGRPLVLFFHGNGENLETLKWSGAYERLAEAGYHAVAVEYPGYGRSGGRPSEASTVEAGLAALEWARRTLGDRPTVVAGWSLGAAVAVQVTAARPDAVDGLVAMSPWTALPDVATIHFGSWLPRLFLRERYDSLAAVERIDCPVLVVHGVADRIIPATQGRELARALGPRARWLGVEGVGHNELLGRPEVWRALRRFVDELAVD